MFVWYVVHGDAWWRVLPYQNTVLYLCARLCRLPCSLLDTILDDGAGFEDGVGRSRVLC